MNSSLSRNLLVLLTSWLVMSCTANLQGPPKYCENPSPAGPLPTDSE